MTCFISVPVWSLSVSADHIVQPYWQVHTCFVSVLVWSLSADHIIQPHRQVHTCLPWTCLSASGPKIMKKMPMIITVKQWLKATLRPLTKESYKQNRTPTQWIPEQRAEQKGEQQEKGRKLRYTGKLYCPPTSTYFCTPRVSGYRMELCL